MALEAREANVEGVGEVTAAELVRMSLRMNPDRVIVGEVRGDEVIPMLNAMSQGNDGSMCTLARGLVCDGIQQARRSTRCRRPSDCHSKRRTSSPPRRSTSSCSSPRAGEGRFVASVRQVVGADGRQVVTNELFEPGPDGRAVPGIPLPHELAVELAAEGYYRDRRDIVEQMAVR